MQCLFQEQGTNIDAVNVPIWASFGTAGGLKLHVWAGLLLQACQEFGVFSSETRATDILLNIHQRFIAIHKKHIVIDVVLLSWEVDFAMVMNLWTLLVIVWKSSAYCVISWYAGFSGNDSRLRTQIVTKRLKMYDCTLYLFLHPSFFLTKFELEPTFLNITVQIWEKIIVLTQLMYLL